MPQVPSLSAGLFSLALDGEVGVGVALMPGDYVRLTEIDLPLLPPGEGE